MPGQEKFQPLHSEPRTVLLVVEDSEEDYEMLMRVIKKNSIDCQIQHCETGEEALDYLENNGEYQNQEKLRKPALILLDLNLPGSDGRTVLKTIKQDPALKFIPVVIFSTSANPQDLEFCYANGANAYVIKPMDVVLLRESVQLLLHYWLKINVTYP